LKEQERTPKKGIPEQQELRTSEEALCRLSGEFGACCVGEAVGILREMFNLALDRKGADLKRRASSAA